MQLLTRLLRARRSLVLLALLATLGALGVNLYWNRILSGMIDALQRGVAPSGVDVARTALVMLASAASAYGMGLSAGWVCECLAHDLRVGYARHIAHMRYAQIEQLGAGEGISKLQNEIGDVSMFLRNNLFDFAADIVRFVATFAWLLWLNPVLALLANAPCALLLWYTAYSSRAISEVALRSQQANTAMGGFSETLIAVFPVLRLFDAAPLLRRKYRAALDSWADASVREEARRARLMSLSALLSCLPLLLLFLVGGLQIVNGMSSIGVLYIFVNLSGNVSGVLMNMPGRIAQFRRFEVNMGRLAPSVEVAAGRKRA